MTDSPFTILAFGRFLPETLRTRYEPSPRPTIPAIEALIGGEWDRRTVEAEKTGRLLFNGEMLRYVSHRVDAGSLHLTVGPTCYRDFVGTNLYNGHRVDELGWERFANPIGTTATLLTSDGCICYGRRSQRVAFHAAHVHTFGGALEAKDLAPDGSIDPFASLCRELHEELGLNRSELHDLQCVGLIRDHQIHQPEMLFEAKTELSAHDLRERWLSADAREEHDEIVSLIHAPDAIAPFLRGCGPIAPVAVGALLLHGRLAWGDAWYTGAIKELPASLR